MHSNVTNVTALQTPGRDMVHDLRNLFGVVSCAGHLLDAQQDEPRRRQLLDAIESAARRGAQLTSDLLARSPQSAITTIDVNSRMASLESMARALAGASGLRVDRCPGRLLAKVDPAAFEAAMLELISNARSASPGSTRIILRVRRVGKRIWILVADDGVGMDRTELAAALAGPAVPTVSGTGLGRVQKFVRASHGHLLIRSSPGRGTVMAITLPVVLGIASGLPDLPVRTEPMYRQPAAA